MIKYNSYKRCCCYTQDDSLEAARYQATKS